MATQDGAIVATMRSMNSEQEKLNKALSGIAGEYFVAAELSRHGMVAAVTLRNTRGIDIVVSRPGKSTSATVQVKTVQNGPAKWLLNKSDEKSKGPNHYYVFVVLHGRNGQPEYRVVEGSTLPNIAEITIGSGSAAGGEMGEGEKT